MQFKRIYIEITNTCNLKCTFCAQNQRTPHAMTIEEFQHVIQQIRPYGKYVYLHVLGEPLSHPQLDELLSITDEAGMKVNITTNGTLLKQKVDLLLRHPLRQMNVSLHSFPQHKMPTYFADIFQVSEQLAAHGIYINYRSWNLHEKDHQEERKQLLLRIKERYATEIDEANLHRLQRIPLQDHIALHFESVFTWPALANPYFNAIGRCLGMLDMCAILSNGDVVPCCLDSKGECVLGNVFTTPFSDIMASDRVRSMINGFQNHQVVEDLCKHCSYRLRFYTVKGEDYAHTNKG